VLYKGRWYVWITEITNTERGPLYILQFYTIKGHVLSDGEWILHPSSPVTSDMRYARMGGRPLIYKGELYRPAQDCSGNPNLSQFNPKLSQFNPNMSQFNPKLSQFNPNLSQFNPNLSQFNPNLSQFNPNLSQFNPDFNPPGGYGIGLTWMRVTDLSVSSYSEEVYTSILPIDKISSDIQRNNLLNISDAPRHRLHHIDAQELGNDDWIIFMDGEGYGDHEVVNIINPEGINYDEEIVFEYIHIIPFAAFLFFLLSFKLRSIYDKCTCSRLCCTPSTEIVSADGPSSRQTRIRTVVVVFQLIVILFLSFITSYEFCDNFPMIGYDSVIGSYFLFKYEIRAFLIHFLNLRMNLHRGGV
jgi:hypothetical protein